MQRTIERFTGAVRMGRPFARRNEGWEFFFRDVFTMFLRWNRPITLIDGTASFDERLMRRKVRGHWQYRRLDEGEMRYILAVENGTHC